MIPNAEKTDNRMKKNVSSALRSKRGMTMAEMLITVAIIIVLTALVFITLAIHQRNLAQKERDAVAREIFIAAQNHLTMAQGVGYYKDTDETVELDLGSTDTIVVSSGATAAETKIYYFIVNNGDALNAEGDSLIKEMLPFGSIDENVRMGGSYIVRYQPDIAKVIDVFYCTTSGKPDNFNLSGGFVAGDSDINSYGNIKNLADKYDENGELAEDNKSKRKNYPELGGSVIGWYGGADAEKMAGKVKVPKIDLINGDTLTVVVDNAENWSDDEDGLKLKLLVTGVTSGARKAITIDKPNGAVDNGRLQATETESAAGTVRYILDDVTGTDKHFATLGLGANEQFLPGEDIRVEAVAYNSKKFANIAYSEAEVENSLFESIKNPKKADNNQSAADGERTAYISSIRHLENLYPDISNLSSTSKLMFTKAAQTADLDWETFTADPVKPGRGTGSSSTSGYNDTSASSGYTPVVPTANLAEYDGFRHSIKNIPVSRSGNAGLFGSFSASGGNIANLELIDFDINTTNGSSAGALAGSLSNTTVTNVIAYNSSAHDDDQTPTIVSAGGSAGGLVGSMDNSKLKYSGAALIVKCSGGSAGGLVGTITPLGSHTTTQDGVTTTLYEISECYSGGHTDGSAEYDPDHYNVIGSTAGGLVGSAGGAYIRNSYSTCSVEGATGYTGGFVGRASGNISNCYCTGLVSGDSGAGLRNAFIADGQTPTVTGCHYYEIVNPYKDVDHISYKSPGRNGVTPLDAETTDGDGNDDTTYNDFLGARTAWNVAVPYDSTVSKYYGNKYELMTVTQLAQQASSTDYSKSTVSKAYRKENPGDYFVNTHYGDWPAPETFIIN